MLNLYCLMSVEAEGEESLLPKGAETKRMVAARALACSSLGTGSDFANFNP